MWQVYLSCVPSTQCHFQKLNDFEIKLGEHNKILNNDDNSFMITATAGVLQLSSDSRYTYGVVTIIKQDIIM